MKKSLLVGLLSFAIGQMISAAPTWTRENIDSVCKGSRATEVEVDREGTVHLAYTGCGVWRRRGGDGDGSHLFYAKKVKGGKWVKTLVDSDNNDVGRFPNIGVDSKGGVHLAYKDHINTRLKYAYLAPGTESWEVKRIGKKYMGSWTSSVMYKDVFYVTTTRYLKKYNKVPRLEMGTLRNGEWSFESLQSYDGGWDTGIAIDANENPIIISHSGSYFRGNSRLTYREDGEWKQMAIDGLSSRHVIAVDSVGHVHIVYGRTSIGKKSTDPSAQLDDVIYATNSPEGIWHKEILAGDEGPDADAFFPSLAIDKNDGIHVAYRDYKYNQLRYMRKLGEKWERFLLDEMGRPLYSTMVVDSDNILHISYESADMLVYGVCKDCTK